MFRRVVAPVLALSLVIASCSEANAGPVTVTGTEECVPTSEEDGVEWYECQETTSDERTSGTAMVSVRMEQAPPTPMEGTFALTNDNGAWDGDWIGEITPEGNHIMEAVLIGSGDYEGLQYRVRWEGVSEPLTITGTIEPVP